MSESKPKYVGIAYLVEHLTYSKWTWRLLADQKVVRCVRLSPGGARKFDLADCEAFLEELARGEDRRKPRNAFQVELYDRAAHKKFIQRCEAREKAATAAASDAARKVSKRSRTSATAGAV